jgi:hypothetical protein
MVDSIEYELVNWEAREVWKCSKCGRYRHRKAVFGIMPALCCSQPATLIDRYQQPIDITVSQSLSPSACEL